MSVRMDIENNTTSSDQRARMVETQLIERGITDDNVLRAMKRVPRELFVKPDHVQFAYDDQPLTIGSGQTISQPFVVAFMIAALELKNSDVVLEIGAGSGYAAAVLSEIARDVFAIERIGALADFARSNLNAAGYGNVHVRHADGTAGWPENAPFDAILVSAGAPAVPQTLKMQLKLGGRMLIPVGESQRDQALKRVTRSDHDTFQEDDLGDVRFVPLIGQEGWHVNRLGCIDHDLAYFVP